jgi:hypothetical protein
LEPEAAGMARRREGSSEVLHLLRENLQGYKLLLQLAEGAHGELAAGNAEGLDDKILRRREIQKEIVLRDAAIERLRENEAHAPLREGIAELVKETVQTVAAIQEIDRKTLCLMEEERGRLRDGILALRQGSKALKSYGKGRSHSPRFVDRRG